MKYESTEEAILETSLLAQVMRNHNVNERLATQLLGVNWIAAHQVKECGSQEALDYYKELAQKVISLDQERFQGYLHVLTENCILAAEDLET